MFRNTLISPNELLNITFNFQLIVTYNYFLLTVHQPEKVFLNNSKFTGAPDRDQRQHHGQYCVHDYPPYFFTLGVRHCDLTHDKSCHVEEKYFIFDECIKIKA